jgi:hypothetical protein
MDKKIFDVVYRKYSKKDYFGTRYCILSQWAELKKRGVKVPFYQIKRVLRNEKEKLYNMILNRIDKATKEGINIFPLREKFTHEIFKIIGLK